MRHHSALGSRGRSESSIVYGGLAASVDSNGTDPANDIVADGDDRTDPLTAAADAGTVAAAEATTAANSAAETTLAAREAAQASQQVAAQARVATATAVAAAASSMAKLAAETAAAVADQAATQAESVATSAAAARETVAARLPDDADEHAARRAAAAVAASVAADVVARATATADAAALVADAVTTAADAAFRAASSAATSVEVAANTAAASAHMVSKLSAATQAASDVVVVSTARFADLGPLLRAAAALHRVQLARNPPLVEDLKAALARSELRLYYQPIYDMATGILVAVEALLRWQHPTRGLLPPTDFLYVAESHPDLVNPVGDWVLATAVEQAQTWRADHGVHVPRIWVNVSCDQLGQGRLRGEVERLLSEADLSPAAIGLEVTERQLIATSGDASSDLAGLRELGIPLALDDFGTGYASLDYLRRFTFDEIKIDRSFVSGLGRDRTDTAVVSSIIELGRSLGLTVVAEGVETQDQYDHLQRLGCARCQGYLLQRPATPAIISGLLQARLGAP